METGGSKAVVRNIAHSFGWNETRRRSVPNYVLLIVARTREIRERGAHQGGAVVEVTEGEIAPLTEQPAYLAGRMTMIDAQGLGGPFPADGASPALVRKQPVVIVRRYSVEGLEPLLASVFCTGAAWPASEFRIFRQPASLARPDLLLVRGMVGPIARACTLSKLRIFRISLPRPVN